MADLQEIVLALKVENEQFKAQMLASQKSVSDATVKMADAVSKFGNNSGKEVSKFGKIMEIFSGVTLSTMAVGAFNMVKDAAIGFAKVLITDSISAAAAAEESSKKLEFALRQSGLGAADTVARMEEFASSLQNVTKYEDDAIKEAMGLIQSLGQLDENGLKGATQAALDLSAALGIDLQTAAKAVGKAAEGETGALSKFGLIIDDNIPKSEKFAAALDKIKDRFGGAAIANANTFTGALEQAKNQFGEIQETIGGFITGNTAVIAVIKEVAKVFMNLNSTLGDGKDSVKQFITGFVWDSLDAFAMLIDGLTMLGNGFIVAFKAIQVPIQAMVDLLQSAVSLLLHDWEGAADAWNETADSFRFDFLDTDSGDKIREFSLQAQKSASEMANANTAAGEAAGEAAKKNTELSDSILKIANSYVEAGLAGTSANELQKALLDSSLSDLTSSFGSRLEAIANFNSQEQALRDQKYASDFEALNAALAAEKITKEEFQIGLAELNNKADVDAIESAKKRKLAEDQINKSRLQTVSDTFGALASLSQTGVKELGGIAKAGAISQATIDGYVAIQKALASAPPPFNLIQAAAIGAVTAANVAKISATPLRTGIDSVPGVGTQDNFPAVLAPGERVVPSKTNQDLSKFLENQNSGSQPIVNITLNIPNAIGVTREQAQMIIEGLNEYVASGGLRLV